MDGLVDAAKASAARGPGGARPRDFDEWILCMMGKVDCTVICIGVVFVAGYLLGGESGGGKQDGTGRDGTGWDEFADYEVLSFQERELQTYS